MKILISFLTVLLVSSFAHADRGGRGRDDRGRGPGRDSFRESCQVVHEDWARIEANCRDLRGRWIYNNFDRSRCSGEIANVNGNLVCETRRGSSLPSGSYLRSCNACDMNGPILQCECRDVRGRERFTSIDVRQCRGEIGNANGQLVCD